METQAKKLLVYSCADCKASRVSRAFEVCMPWWFLNASTYSWLKNIKKKFVRFASCSNIAHSTSVDSLEWPILSQMFVKTVCVARSCYTPGLTVLKTPTQVWPSTFVQVFVVIGSHISHLPQCWEKFNSGPAHFVLLAFSPPVEDAESFWLSIISSCFITVTRFLKMYLSRRLHAPTRKTLIKSR